MAKSNAGTVSIRLAVIDGKIVEKEFKGLGREGRKALDQIARGVSPANRGMRALDRTIGEVRSRLRNFSGHLGPIGAGLQAIGPAGAAAAIGIGATALALRGALRVAREATREFDALAKAADTVGLTTDLYQALQLKADEAGVAQDRLNTALRGFVVRAGEVSTGAGELVEKLRRINPELLDQIKNADGVEAKLRVMASAIQNTSDAQERAVLAAAAFGTRNVDLVRILGDTSESFDDIIERGKELGVVIDEEVLRNAEEMENKLGVASRVIDLNLKRAFIDLVPAIVTATDTLADFIRGVRQGAEIVGDLFRDVERMSSRGVRTRYADVLNERIEAQALLQRLEELPQNNRIKAQIGRVRGQISHLTKEAESLQKELDVRTGYKEDFRYGEDYGSKPGDVDKITAELRKQADIWIDRITPAAEKHKATLAEIATLEQKGALSSEQATAARAKAEEDYQQTLKKVSSAGGRGTEAAKMLREVEQLLSAARTPAEDLEGRLKRIAELRDAGAFERAMGAGKGDSAAQRAATAAMVEFLETSEGSAEALARLREIAGSGAGMEALAAKAALARDQMRQVTLAGEGARQIVTDNFSDAVVGIVEGEDALDGFASALENVAKIALRMSSEQLIYQALGGGVSGPGGVFGFGSLLGSVGSMIGGWFGGGYVPSTSTAAIYHDGTMSVDARPKAVRDIPYRVLAQARRYHEGTLRVGERAAILEDDEAVLSRAMKGQIAGHIRDLEGLAQMKQQASDFYQTVMKPTFNINVSAEGGEAEVTKRQNGQGGFDLDVVFRRFRQAVADDITSGGPVRGAISRTFGLSRGKTL